MVMPATLFLPAASSFSFCRPAVEYRTLPEDFKQQLTRRTGGNLTWHEGRGQKTAGGRTVKLLQQPGTEALQVLNTYMTSTCQTAVLVHGVIAASGFLSTPDTSCEGHGFPFCFIDCDGIGQTLSNFTTLKLSYFKVM